MPQQADLFIGGQLHGGDAADGRAEKRPDRHAHSPHKSRHAAVRMDGSFNGSALQSFHRRCCQQRPGSGNWVAQSSDAESWAESSSITSKGWLIGHIASVDRRPRTGGERFEPFGGWRVGAEDHPQRSPAGCRDENAHRPEHQHAGGNRQPKDPQNAQPGKNLRPRYRPNRVVVVFDHGRNLPPKNRCCRLVLCQRWFDGWVAHPERAWLGGSPRPFRACHPSIDD